MSSAAMPGTAPRRDIEGLRAIAVLAVVAVPLLGGPVGGFVGIDVFFVISGFLVTGLLLREARGGGISFREFYARRIRRMAPAGLLVLGVICLVAHAAFAGSRAGETYVDALWAALSLANWRMAASGADFFASTLTSSPVQHYWSLSVLGQLSLAWPLVIFALTRIAKRYFGGKDTAVLGVGLGVLVATSFAWAVYQSATNPTVASFSTLTRAWELGVGGLLCLLVPVLATRSEWLGRGLMIAGIVVIGVSLVFTTPELPFPGPWAAPAVLGTALVIAGGSVEAAPTNLLLANPVARFLGDISYSLYLWHWPVAIFTLALVPQVGPLESALMVAGAVAVAAVSCYAVEQPIRRTTWLSAPERGPRRFLSQRAVKGYTAALVAGAVASVLFLASPAPAVTNAQPIDVPDVPPITVDSESTEQAPEGSSWSEKVDAAVAATKWPALRPALDSLKAARAPQWKGCINVDERGLANCHFGAPAGTAKKSVVVLGDAVAVSWLPSVIKGLGGSWSVQGLTWGQCPAPRIDMESGDKDAAFTKTCADHQAFAIGTIKQLKPDVVILSNSVGTLSRVKGANGTGEALTAWRRAQRALLASLSGTKVLVLAAPPSGKDLAACAKNGSVPVNCLATVSAEWTAMATVDHEVSKDAKATYVSTKEWFCDAKDRCPAFIGTTPVMADAIHLTDAMAQLVAPQVKAAVTAATAKK